MSALDIDLLDYLRLEVETDPVGLTNLVANPSGELGGWGWVTPVAGSVLAGTGTRLRLTTPTPAAATYAYTEAYAVAAGEYVAASWITSAMSGGYYRAKIEWLNAAGALISASAQTGYLQASASTVPIGPFLAPALTAYARLRFDVYSTNAGANPVAGTWMEMYQVTMAKAATSGALGSLRNNLVPNPSFETNATLWSTTGANSLARSTAQHQVGAASLAITALGTANFVVAETSATGTGAMPVTPGADYAIQGQIRSPLASSKGWISAYWYTSTGAFISYTQYDMGALTQNAWTQLAKILTAPANAAYLRINFQAQTLVAGNIPNGTVVYLDAVMVEQSTTPTVYFDGNTAAAGGWTYGWTGTANLSPSSATSTNLAYIAPVTYQNILGGSVSLDINRRALDVGTIQALIKDASLDPATAELIRPGRAVRLRALNDDTGAWDVLAQGTLDKGRVSYDLRKAADKQASITLATYDPNQVLANTNRPDGVATIADLPYVLEGARVPWNVNGSGDQVATATVASSNDQANALDQVVLARDSDLGYAWVTKEGVLTAYDDRTLDYYGAGTAVLDESVYSGLDVTFDPDDCINEVMVNLRRFTTTGEVEEVAFGPYRDAASIAEWGVHQKTFTVHGIAEASLAAYAAAILAANATPTRRINSVRLPIRSAADLVQAKALLDLYAKVQVLNTDKDLDQTLRVTGIQHQISARRWTMLLTFDQVDTVAVPVPTTPQGGNGLIPIRAYREAVGQATHAALAAGTGTSIAVTFPAGRFTVTPNVQVTGSSNGYNAGCVAAVTTAGCTVRNYNPQAAAHSGTETVYWRATQMTETAVSG